ncbi:hypothetical protein GCWU000341_00212 [Oribacterium sp. oral taxon 078 str. F0262]|nr:hypothetical protein GCWU000341_00212 [Oribacterium sp. oral taxon 078 str. F0262]
MRKWISCKEFQSTLPSRGATVLRASLKLSCGISIHAPLAGSDIRISKPSSAKKVFQSTLPSRGATCGGYS